jgi:flagellar assembly factor FliW
MAVDGEVPEIRFVRPVPGFAALTRFALVRLGEADDPAEEPVLFELRSLDDPDVAFVVARPSAYFSDYEFELDEASAADLGLKAADDALILVVLTVGADAASTTANLLAPVVVNVRTRSAAQVILSGTDWPVRAAVV